MTFAIVLSVPTAIQNLKSKILKDYEISRVYDNNTCKWIGIGVKEHIIESKHTKALKVVDVLPDSPAMIAGIKQGDIIECANGHRISKKDELKKIVYQTPVGKKISLNIFRGGQNNTFSITISKLP